MNLHICPLYLPGVTKVPLIDARITRLTLKSLHPLGKLIHKLINYMFFIF